MIDVASESLISLAQAARRLPAGRQERPVSTSCLLRWVLKGIPGPDGERVRLEAIRLGGRWLTSNEALARFAERLTPNLDAEASATPRTRAARERAAGRAERELDKLGI
jgi:Protein of unknown function (DUF1580)